MMNNFIYLLSLENWPADSITPTSQFFNMSLFWLTFRVIAATVVVALMAYYATKMMARSRGRGRAGGNLRLLESISLGGQVSVQLVKAGEKYLVLGMTRERVSLLAELNKDEVEELPEPQFGDVKVPFASVLSRFLPPKDEGIRDDNEETNSDENESSDSRLGDEFKNE